jgi:LysM repeat protein
MNGSVRAAILVTLVTAAAMVAATVTACDREGPQVLLIRGTPEATPTTARVIAPESTPSAVTTPTRPAEPTTIAAPTATSTPLPSPTRTPSPVPATPVTAISLPTATPQPGTTLAPSATATAMPTGTLTPTPRVHIVQYGETLANIAERYSVTIAAVARLNNITNLNRIYVGQRLLIP